MPEEHYKMTPTPVRELRSGRILQKPEGGLYQIETITSAKPGKHGAARVIVSGRNLSTRRHECFSYTGRASITVVTLGKARYTITEVDDDVTTLGVQDTDGTATTLDLTNASWTPEYYAQVKELLAGGGTWNITAAFGPGFLELTDLIQTDENA
ncbi:hypothetical protein AB0P15_30965 [Streptomyces sp. NPDC087917]|uniref:hypothetical protein n=1 Tax=Streptomyces sp. NPDC087917 TaxID=3155060 RepID=UPI00343C0C09